jgi:hypothetical protein
VDHIQRAPVRLECGLRLEAVPVLVLLLRRLASVRKDVPLGLGSVMFRVA